MVNEDFTTVGSWCDQDGDTFLVADPNGDHNDDWICHHGDGSICNKYNSLIFGGKSNLLNGKTIQSTGTKKYTLRRIRRLKTSHVNKYLYSRSEHVRDGNL